MRQNFVGMVVSNAMQKTVKVKVIRQKLHPVVLKTMKTHKNYLAHDENQLCGLGDVVRIEACRPLSKHKKFTVAEIVRSSKA
ncbi:30S ribosomal protein S17 [Halteromyces radiatus]|uniref:30S ribosomal protein S17 n=1 Tax=Halteromyces radiatus TaxID=101107 RepID=UPI00221EDC0E|nr:30S ribosomal protein S17 [Halteromyces radiatus]KAI8099523.1 30S ribosomal protein S17 [Halteromyces radiatus]